jgi:hypothetical protein
MTSWHEQDDFWETVPLFEQQRLEAAPQEVDALLSLLLDVGFESVALHGGLGGATYDTSAQRLVAVARKAGA